MDQAYLGIEIGGTKLQVVAGNIPGQIRKRWRFTVDASRGGVGIREQLDVSVREILSTGTSVRAIGVGFGGPIDWQTGLIACSHQVEGWSGFDLASWLRDRSGVPVRLDNDANVAALGEATAGAGRGFNPVFYVTLGSGVGGGLVVNGHIYHGAKPGEAEIGHVRLDRAGAIVESRCSGWAVDQRIRELKARQPESRLARLTASLERGEARCLAAACEQGDPFAWQILRETAEDLAFALSHVVHLFHPEMIVIGGGLALTGEILRAEVAKALPRFVMEVFAPGPQIRLAALGEDSVPVGALQLAHDAAESGAAPPAGG